MSKAAAALDGIAKAEAVAWVVLGGLAAWAIWRSWYVVAKAASDAKEAIRPYAEPAAQVGADYGPWGGGFGASLPPLVAAPDDRKTWNDYSPRWDPVATMNASDLDELDAIRRDTAAEREASP